MRHRSQPTFQASQCFMPLIEVFFANTHLANTHLGIGFDGKVFFLIIQGKYSLQKFLDSSFFGTSQIF